MQQTSASSAPNNQAMRSPARHDPRLCPEETCRKQREQRDRPPLCSGIGRHVGRRNARRIDCIITPSAMQRWPSRSQRPRLMRPSAPHWKLGLHARMRSQRRSCRKRGPEIHPRSCERSKRIVVFCRSTSSQDGMSATSGLCPGTNSLTGLAISLRLLQSQSHRVRPEIP